MDYLIIIIVAVAIILTILSKIYVLSMVFPTLLIILAIMLCFVSSSIKNRKDNKNLQEIKKSLKENKK